MRIVLVAPTIEPIVADVENELEKLQGLVGGNIEVTPFINDILCVCNEEGKLLDLAPNFFLNGDVICGTAFFCGDDGEEFRGLTDEESQIVVDYFMEGRK